MAFHWTIKGEKKKIVKIQRAKMELKIMLHQVLVSSYFSAACPSQENENNPESSCDSEEVAISQITSIFHHSLQKRLSSRPKNDRQKEDKQNMGASVPHRRSTFVTCLYIKQRITSFLLCRVLHVDLAIWTLEGKKKQLNGAKGLHAKRRTLVT